MNCVIIAKNFQCKEVDAVSKKFFAVMIVAVLMLTARIAAAVPVDWSKAPRIGTKAELARFVEGERRNGETTFCVVLTNGLKTEDHKEFLSLAPAPHVDISWTYRGDGTAYVTYRIKEYPGTRVANAYLCGNTDWLSRDELKLYDIAVGIVDEAKKFSSPADKERYIYEAVCKRATFYSEDNMKNLPNFVTAIGALVDGRANCQGYADAFYMLGRMCGLNVGRIIGNDDTHAWNWIELDGKVYCVDTTKGDTLIDGVTSYVYFNAPLEIMRDEHVWEWDVIPALQRKIDKRYAYRMIEGLTQASSAEDGLKLIAQRFADNKKIVRVMTPFDERFSEANVQQAVDYVVNELNARNCAVKFTVNAYQCGKYLFFTGVID